MSSRLKRGVILGSSLCWREARERLLSQGSHCLTIFPILSPSHHIYPLIAVAKMISPVYTFNEFKEDFVMKDVSKIAHEQMNELPLLLSWKPEVNITKDYTIEDLAIPRADGKDVPELYEAGEIAKRLQVSMSTVLRTQDLESKEVARGSVARTKMFDSMYLVSEVVAKQRMLDIMLVARDHNAEVVDKMEQCWSIIKTIFTIAKGLETKCAVARLELLDSKDQFKDKVDQYKDVVKADLRNTMEDNKMDMLMMEMSKVYMLEVMEEDCDEKEIVAKHTCGLSRRPVVSSQCNGKSVVWQHTMVIYREPKKDWIAR